MSRGRFSKQLNRIVELIEDECGGWKYLSPQSQQVRFSERPGGFGEIYCGEGRYDTGKQNALLFKNGVAINFQIILSPSEPQPKIETFTLCCAFPDQVRILYHFDPGQASGDHPEYHIELTTNGEDALWGEKMRYPVGRVDPFEILRFFFQLAREESCRKLKRGSE